jgi:hypothetical protein
MSERTHRPAAAVAAVLLVLALAACGGDDDTAAPAATAEPTTSSPSPSPTFDEAAAEAELRTNWESFFDGTVPQESKPALVERGEELGEALALAAQDPNAGASAATVQDVSFVGPTEAMVTYDILSGGQVVLAGAQGKGVEEDGTWKVSAQTFCQLTALSSGQTEIAGCT